MSATGDISLSIKHDRQIGATRHLVEDVPGEPLVMLDKVINLSVVHRHRER